MVKRMKRGTAFTLVAAGILLILVFGKPLGLFSLYGDPERNLLYPDKCIEGDKKCCGTRNLYCEDGTGDIQVICSPTYYQNGSFAYWRWMSTQDTPCESNVLSRKYYRLENNECNSYYMAVSDKTDNDYYSFGECLSNVNRNEIGQDNSVFDYECDCLDGQKSCANFVYFTCENSGWINNGETHGKCGYTIGGSPSLPCGGLTGSAYAECLYGTDDYVNPDMDCDYYTQNQETCSNGVQDVGEEGVDCGGVCIHLRECETGEGLENSLNEVIFTIGDFQIKLWMLLLLIGAIVVLLIIK